MVAMTSQGELYSWGHNGYGQLGLGASVTTGQGTIPRRLCGDFSGVRIVSVACGGHHTIAVTAAGKVCTEVVLITPFTILLSHYLSRYYIGSMY